MKDMAQTLRNSLKGLKDTGQRLRLEAEDSITNFFLVPEFVPCLIGVAEGEAEADMLMPLIVMNKVSQVLFQKCENFYTVADSAEQAANNRHVIRNFVAKLIDRRLPKKHM